MKWRRFIGQYLGVAFTLFPMMCFAANLEGVTNPWEKVLKSIVDSVTGPVAYGATILVIFGCGVAMAAGDLQGAARKLVPSALGISIFCFAGQIVSGFISFQGALL